MSVIIQDVPGLEEASAELERLIAADAAADAAAGSAGEGNPTDDDQDPDLSVIESLQTATDGQHAAQTDKDNSTPEQAEPAPDPKSKTDSDTPATEKKGDEGKSRYAKAQERLGKTWEEINAEKTVLKTERETLQREREEFERLRTEHKQKLETAEAEFTPEQYEQAAKRFEDDGKFDLAEMAKRKADDLRRNPPAQRQAQAAAAVETQRKEWALKAGQEFPELVKQNSPLQVRTAEILRAEPDLNGHPKGIYMAARLAHLETEAGKAATAAARVSELEQELNQAKTKITELEQLTALPGPGSAVRPQGAKAFAQMSEDEQFAELEREAQEVGSLIGR